MNESLAKVTEFINQKTLRERWVILLLIIAVVYLIVDLLALGGLLDERAGLNATLEDLQVKNEQNILNAETVKLEQQNTVLKNTQLKDDLRRQLNELNKRLLSAASGFVPADLMSKVLEEVLTSHNDLKLLLLENIPAQAVSEHDKHAGEVLYRHGVKLQLQGGYPAVLAYLQSLESLTWYFEWHTLSFKVEKYPLGTLVLEVYTYSTDKGWLGV